MVIAWLLIRSRVSLWVLGKAEARKDKDGNDDARFASTDNSPVWITVLCVCLLLLCITNGVLDCRNFPMPCIPVEHVRHPSIYLHAHSIIFNPSTWHSHQQQQQQHCCHPRPCPESSAMEKRMEISQIRIYPQPPTQFTVSNRRPSLVNSLPFPCHSVLPSSGFLLAQESTDISSINLNRSSSPINKISLWPWEPTPLYLQLQRHFLPIWHWNLNRIHPLLIIICRKQSSLHCLLVLYFP